MKTFNVNFEEIAAWTALHEAWRFYRRGKRRRPDVAAFEIDADRSLLHLSDALLGRGYRHGPYKILTIRDPKPRLIAAAPVRDRIVHTAVYRALAPHFNKGFIDQSYACIEGRGTHRALWHFLALMRRYRYLVHLDIHSFFPTVSHSILHGLLTPRLRDPRIIGLLEEILASGQRLYRTPRVRQFFGLPEITPDLLAHGLPIGNLTSQWWGNLYLNGLDHFAKRVLKIEGYIRYMDDIVCFARDKASLKQWKHEIRQWLATERNLTLNPNKGHLRSCSLPVTYLGYRVTRGGYDPGPQGLKRFRKTLRKRALGSATRLRQSLHSYRAWVLG
ncbi:MAG: reverse transcriptase domain-containing protein [Acidobacteriota bacterium]|nr:reverse transcriptase domain-containing protein [Acidobacteriota bacterium]